MGYVILTGDWIYPSRISLTRIRYNIDYPLVLEIFRPAVEKGKPVSERPGILHHTVGPQFVEFSVEGSFLNIIALKDTRNAQFSREIGFAIPFEIETLDRIQFVPNAREPRADKKKGLLARMHELIIGTYPKHNYAEHAIFFTSVCLQAHLNGHALPPGLEFRQATIPEIESLGRWE